MISVIGFIDYSMIDPAPPEGLAERISIALIGWNSTFVVTPVRSEKHRRFGLVFTRSFARQYTEIEMGQYRTECERYFVDELSRERAEMEEEFDVDEDI
jgi:hypothetical protein